MTPRTNHLDQPVDEPVPGWTARPRPPRAPMEGQLCRLLALDASARAAALYDAHGADAEGRNWTYLPYGPFDSAEDYAAWIRSVESSESEIFYSIEERPSGRPVGVASYLGIDPAMGCIEVGHLCYAPTLQRTAAATEARYLMMRRAFDELGYRRYEWRCDGLNTPSLAAAKRLGFRCEGIFRNAVVVKGRNRGTAWFSITDEEWPGVRSALEAWLDASNFDASGRQKKRLGEFTPHP